MAERKSPISVKAASAGAGAVGAGAVGTLALGSFALGAIAMGAVAIGALAIGRLSVGKARFKSIDIDELTVRKLRMADSLQLRDATETPALESDGASVAPQQGLQSIERL